VNRWGRVRDKGLRSTASGDWKIALTLTARWPWMLEGKMIEALGMIEVALLTWAMSYIILFPIGGGSRLT
jgi:hypothetical protein